jgi:hypothetical protein
MKIDKIIIALMFAMIMASVVTIMLARRQPVAAAGQFICPYDGRSFDTLAELQAYEQANFPNERLSIEITWD